MSNMSCRQKDMQRQLEKLTDLIQLIVNKMNIRTDMKGDDSIGQSENNDHGMKMQRFRQTFAVGRRFSLARSSQLGKSSYSYDHLDRPI
jgi:hypothetical protein